MMKKKDVVKYLVVGIIFVSLIGSLIILRGGLTGFAIFGSSDKIGAFAQTQIFFDGFESGIGAWTLSHASGANDWTASTTDPYQGSYHAQAQPMSTTEPASIMQKTISTSGYQNIIVNYSRKLVGLDGVDEFQVEWYDGNSWTILEQTGGDPADDAIYVSKQFSLGSGANNNAVFAIKFECTAGATSEYCRVDNVRIIGDEIITDTTPPTISIIYPLNTNYNVNISQLNYTYYDDNPGYCWYSINNGLTNSSPVSAGQNFTDILSNEGSNTWIVYCNDSVNNKNSASLTFFKDTIIPNINIVSPLNNSNHSSNLITINYTVSDTNLQSCWWTNNSGLTNNSITCGNNITETWDQGYNAIVIYANDSAGNKNSSSVTFYIDSAAPSVNIILPQEGASYGYNNSISLNYSVSDVNLQSCWYNIDNGNNVTLNNCTNTTFGVSGNGNYVIKVYANDSFGNLNFDSNSFNVQVGAPTIILNSPIDSYLDSHDVTFSYTPTDIDLDYCELWGNFDGEFKLNQTNNSPVSGSENTFSLNLNDGTYLWNINCVDDIGNSAFNGNKSFYVDTIVPAISLTEPAGAKTSRTISASWSVSDANLNSCWYNVYQGASLEIANTSVNCSDNSISFDVSVDANFVFNFYANDSAGNSNNASSSFSVDTSIPVNPPSGVGGGGGGGGGSILSNASTVGKLSVSQIGSIIAHEGDKKTFSLNVKNIGKIFLNNCRLIVRGNISSWVYSTTIKGIAPGENLDFNFDLNVPEEIGSGDYNGELEIKCDEGSNIQSIKVSIPGLSVIEIKEIVQDKNILKINYEFDNSDIVGNDISIDIWFVDEDRIEVKRVQDIFPINREGLIERTLEIDVKDLAGIYNIYFALSDDLNNFVRQSVVIRKSGTTGFAIFDTTRNKMIVYVIFLVIIAIAIFFIWKRHGKEKRSEHLWLLRKKAESKNPYKQFH